MKKSFFIRDDSALTHTHGYSTDKKDFKWYEASVPCRSACPADTDIPGYLEAIYKKDFDKAYQINLEDNIFPEILVFENTNINAGLVLHLEPTIPPGENPGIPY